MSLPKSNLSVRLITDYSNNQISNLLKVISQSCTRFDSKLFCSFFTRFTSDDWWNVMKGLINLDNQADVQNCIEIRFNFIRRIFFE